MADKILRQFLLVFVEIQLFDVDQTSLSYHVGDSLVRPFLLNGEGDGGGASSALIYYQITGPTKLSLASFNQVIG
jgi:hypothetical protein